MSTATEFDLSGFLGREQERVDQALRRAVDALDHALPEPLTAPARYAVLTGGKRLRPILCVSAWRAATGQEAGPEAYDLGCSLELIHAYSLMHDDLPCMDDAGLRRGKATPHVVFGEEDAMRAGAALIPAAGLVAWRASRALGCEDGRAGAVVAELMRAAGGGGMVGGQMLDLVGEGAAFNPVQLDGLHRRKTGALLRASLRVGGLAGGASPAVLEALGAYGRAVGLAFQIADDVLDATATAEDLGKVPSDQDLEKSTYVSLYGLDEARERAHREVRAAEAALEQGQVEAPELRALARYIVDRRR